MDRFDDNKARPKPRPEEETAEEQMKRQLAEARDAIPAVPGVDAETPSGKDTSPPPSADTAPDEDISSPPSVETLSEKSAGPVPMQEKALPRQPMNSIGGKVDQATLDALRNMAQKNGGKNSDQPGGGMPSIEDMEDTGLPNAPTDVPGTVSAEGSPASTKPELRKKQEAIQGVDESMIRNLKVGDIIVMKNGERG